MTPKGASPYHLRYTFGTRLCRRRCLIKTAHRLMRHETAWITLQLYAQFFDEDIVAGVEALMEDVPKIVDLKDGVA